MIPNLVTVGGLTVDNVISADGTVALARVGGNGAYSAVGALCWSEAIGLVSIATSSYPKQTLAALAASGISLDGVVTSEAVLSRCEWFIYDADGHRNEKLRGRPDELAAAGFSTEKLTPAEVARWLDLLRSRGEPPELSYSQFRDANPLKAGQVPASYLEARGVHLAPSRPVVLNAMLPLFNGTGMVVTLDSGWQLAEESFDALKPILAEVDAFLPSEVELTAIFPQTGLEDALALLAGACRGTAAVKLGGRGSLIWDKAAGRAVHVPALPTQAVDPTGAGDSFCGGFLAGLVETGDPVKAACFGTVSASLIVSRFGADGALPVDRQACRARLAPLLAGVAASHS